LGGILFFPCLKVRPSEVATQLGDPGLPRRVAILTMLKLLVFPLATYAVVWSIAPTWAPGVTLVAMMPAGLTSLAFTDLNHGNRTKALILVAVTSVLSPLTVPLLLTTIAPIHSDDLVATLVQRAIYIVTLLAAPFLAAQMLRRVAHRFIDRHPLWWTQGSMVCSCALGFASIAINRQAWAGWSVGQMMIPLALGCASVGLTALGCWITGRRLARPDAIAFTCGALFLNNGLAVAFGNRFFPGQVEMVLPAALIIIPMVLAMAFAGAGWRRGHALSASAPSHPAPVP